MVTAPSGPQRHSMVTASEKKRVRTLKSRVPPAHGSNRSNIRRWPRISSEKTSARLYWKFAEDFLFVVRPLPEGRFLFEGMNPAFESFLGVSSEDVGKIAVSDCMNREDANSVQDALCTCLAEGTEIRVRHRLAFGGSWQDIETVVTPVRDPTTRNISKLIGSHRALAEASSESVIDRIPGGGATMNIGLVSLQEDIQQRIASDLHDSTCQHLIAASLSAMRIRSKLGDPANAERLCDDIDASIDQALKEIRAFAYLLHPQNLTVDGLKVTIEQYADGFAARTSLTVKTNISPDVDRLSYEKQRSLLRVIQEALANVFRHAKATEVEIGIEATDSHFHLRISDNGRGLPISQAAHGAKAISIGVGIPAMKARLEQIGGTLDIRSARATRHPGTTLHAVFPHNLAMKKVRPTKGHRSHDGSHRHVMEKAS
jgi:two-component system NarL family sensor kinase